MFLRSPPIELVDINEWISLINTSITSQISSLLPSSLVGTFKFYSHSDFQLYVLCVQLLSNIWLFCGPWTLNPPASVHGIFQSRILEWVAISFSRGSSRPRYYTPIARSSCIGRQFLYHSAAREAPAFSYTVTQNSVICCSQCVIL